MTPHYIIQERYQMSNNTKHLSGPSYGKHTSITLETYSMSPQPPCTGQQMAAQPSAFLTKRLKIHSHRMLPAGCFCSICDSKRLLDLIRTHVCSGNIIRPAGCSAMRSLRTSPSSFSLASSTTYIITGDLLLVGSLYTIVSITSLTSHLCSGGMTSHHTLRICFSQNRKKFDGLVIWLLLAVFCSTSLLLYR